MEFKIFPGSAYGSGGRRRGEKERKSEKTNEMTYVCVSLFHAIECDADASQCHSLSHSFLPFHSIFVIMNVFDLWLSLFFCVSCRCALHSSHTTRVRRVNRDDCMVRVATIALDWIVPGQRMMTTTTTATTTKSQKNGRILGTSSTVN